MSQILIISDTHFLREHDLEEFFNTVKGYDAIIHCGDIFLGFDPKTFHAPKPLYICRGNNDFANLEQTLQFEIDGTLFYITHGHINHLSYEPLEFLKLRKDYPANVFCFGHTHIPYFNEVDDVTLINPGSLALPRNYPRHRTYAIYDTVTRQTHFYDYPTLEEIVVPQPTKGKK